MGKLLTMVIIMAIFCGVQEPHVLVYQERSQKLVLMSIISFMTSKAVSIQILKMIKNQYPWELIGQKSIKTNEFYSKSNHNIVYPFGCQLPIP